MADIAKPQVGKPGWNTAVDAVIDKVNAHDANPLVTAAVTAAGAVVAARTVTDVPLTLQAASGQTASGFEYKNSAGDIRLRITAGGFLRTAADVGLVLGDLTGPSLGQVTNLVAQANNYASVTTAHAAQSIDIEQWRDSTATVRAAITKEGGLRLNPKLSTAAVAGMVPSLISGTYLAIDAATPTTVTYLGAQSHLAYGSGVVAPTGTVHTYTATLDVLGSGSTSNEHAAFMGWLRYQNGAQARAWFTDWSLHGPIAAQPTLLNGITMLVNNHYNGSPSGGPSAGQWIITRPASGGGSEAGHSVATSYKMDVGLGVVGYCGTTAAPTRGFEVGIQVGGYGSAWMPNTEASKIGTALRLVDPTDAAVKIESAGTIASAITWSGTVGGAADVNLYRFAANVLRTDDTMVSAGLLIGTTTNDVLVKIINAAADIPTARFRNTAAGNTVDLVQFQDIAGTSPFVIDVNARPRWNTAAMAQLTVGAAGAASALPALPAKYLKVVDASGTVLVIPAYAAA